MQKIHLLSPINFKGINSMMEEEKKHYTTKIIADHLYRLLEDGA